MADTETLHMLVVEDDDDDFVLLDEMLKQHPQPMHVDRAASVDDALLFTARRPYDLFLLDYRLGAQSGLDLMRRLKAQEVSAPIIFLTGQGDEDVAVAAMKLGATDYLAKCKLTPPALSRAISYACSLREKENAIRRAQAARLLDERRLEALLELNRLSASSEEEITSFSLEQAIGLTGSRYGYLGFLDSSEAVVVKHLWSQQVQRDCRLPDRRPSFHAGETGLWAAAVAARRPVITNDYAAVAGGKGCPPGHVALTSHVSVPIFDGERIVGVAGVANKPAAYDDSDVRQLTLLMEGMWRILQRQRLQQQLLQSQKMEAVGQLAGGIAHDFNNLLMIIGSYSELLADGVKRHPALRRGAEEVQKAARKAADLTRQLLAFSRKQVLSPRLLDLNQIVADSARLLPRLIGENIALQVLPGEHLWPVKADPVQVDQVIMNLAVNARDAMPTGGSITLETRNVELDQEYARAHPGVPPGEYVMLAVSDSGCGIAPEVLPRIFEPFFTTKEVGHGTGLGLPTVYGIVRQSGGSVWVYSEVGHGTVFKIYLPRASSQSSVATTASSLVAPFARAQDSSSLVGLPATTSEQPAASAHERATSDEQRQTNHILLLVEDEEALRQVTSEFLRARGYTVLEARDGREALDTARSCNGAIHVLVTDVVMPGISGRELAAELEKISPATRVLYVSGYTEHTVVRHGVQPNSMFLQKPFALADLAARIRELLEANRAKAA